MKNVEDGVYLMYVKDGTAYPVAMTKEQVDMLPIVIRMLGGKISVLIDKPLGKVVNLIGKSSCD